MNRLACKFVDYLITNEIISSDMKQEHIYGFEVLFGKILNYGTLLLLAFINHNIVPTLFFMVTFLPLRGRTGGYHAPKESICYLGTLIIYFCVSKVIAPFLLENIYVLVCGVGISVIVIFLFAPVNHPNLGLNRSELEACKSSSRWLATLISICVFISIWLDIIPVYISYVVAGIGLDAGLLILAKILKQEVQKDEESEGKNFERLEIPKNNNTTLVSGTIYFIPMNGISINMGYSNYSSDFQNIDLSSIPDGNYMIKIDGAAVGSTGTASVRCTIN